jgi:hypothetical protein
MQGIVTGASRGRRLVEAAGTSIGLLVNNAS